MQVSDSNGEISASVAETNRVRAELGMQPLAEAGGDTGTRDREEEARLRGQERAEALAKEQAEDELRDKMESAKRQRLLHQKLSGKSLGEMLEGEEMDSALGWVEKSRRQEEARKEKRKEVRSRKPRAPSVADVQSRRYDEMDAEEQSQVAGALVGHSAADFKEGESVVLTLADQAVIEEEGNSYSLNDKEEMLENVNMAEEWRRKHAHELATTGKYNPYAENKNILGKYDEDEGRTTLKLDSTGTVDEAKLKKLAAIKKRLEQSASVGGSVTNYDLSSSGGAPVLQMGEGVDYQTAEEVAAFKKPAGKAKKLRKKAKAGLDLDALAAETSGAQDRGTREDREARASERAAADEEARDSKKQRFDRAVAIAGDKAMQGGQSGAEAMSVEGDGGGEEESAEVDAELRVALDRIRRLGAMKAEKRNEDFAAKRVVAQLEVAQQHRAARTDEEAAAGVDLGQLEFSETGEFCKAVRAKDEGESLDLPSAQYKQLKADTESSKTQDGPVKGEDAQVKQEAEEGDVKMEEDDDDDDEAGGSGRAGHDLLRERSASGGLGAVLDIVRNRGMLLEEKESSGRMFDQKGAGLHAYEDDGEETSFNLSYYDEYGRKMTQKQAFRQLSWKFHGKGPSKKRREKRMLEVEKQMAEKTKDRAMEYMGALQQAQQSTKSAHVVLSGVHAIKPSDMAPPVAPDRSKAAGKKRVKSEA